MAKCPKCGKKGLFLKLTNKGVCKDCMRLALIEENENEAQERLKKLEQILADKETYKKQVQNEALTEIADKISLQETELSNLKKDFINTQKSLSELDSEIEKANKTLRTNTNKVLRLKEIYKSIDYAITNFYEYYDWEHKSQVLIPDIDNQILEALDPTVKVSLHCMDIKELRKKFKENEKAISEVLENYKGKYTTKANQTIYKLMVIALEAELQNVLSSITYGKLENAIDEIKTITSKYLNIAAEGSQTIVNTVVKFIGQIEYLFIEAVKIEYEYFIQKERIKEEQRALREQIRQEAEERRQLEEQRKQIEREEEKYHQEIESLKIAMSTASDDKNIKLQQRIADLEALLYKVNEQKDEITKLQNGKAGYVYVISNLGSFGDHTFKIGMTRRLNPQERVDELGSASVPFPFDVHSFIFSENAVGLENSLHKRLHNQRLNKINLRKEFFNVSVEELQHLIEEIEPTAEFKLTMLAQQYKQSLSIANGDIDGFAEVLSYDFLGSEEIA